CLVMADRSDEKYREQFGVNLTGPLGQTTRVQEEPGGNGANARILRAQTEELGAERMKRVEAERIGRIKDEFLANLSHEIRTPLNAILGWSELLLTVRPSPAELAEGLDVIRRNARAQARLIEDLLDMSRIVSGTLRLDVQ